MTVFLELSVEGCLARIDARGGVRDRFESLEKLTAIRDSYERALALLVAGGQRVVRVDAGQSVEDVYHDVLACL